MGCGRSKGSVKSTSPSEDRRRVDADDLEDDSRGGSSRVKGESSGGRHFTPSSSSSLPHSSVCHVEGLTKSQQEFFRQLDERIDQGEELDNEALERENQCRMQQLMHEWREVVQSRPVTTRAALVGRRRSSPTARLADCRLNGGPPVGGAEEQGGRHERSCRSSRRAARASSLVGPGAAEGDVVDGEPESPAVSVTKLLQLGDAYVRDLDAGDPDGFVRLGRRASVYEEVAIPEEAADGCVTAGQTGKHLSAPAHTAL